MGSMSKDQFKPVDPKVNFVELEKKLLDFWYKQGIAHKYLHKNDSSNKNFSFLDGPITANNPMGVHHAWGRTYKDLWQRYKNMQGFKQRFQNGFDAQGLWVEVEVEKELGLKSKKDIENLVAGDLKASIAKFIELCKQRVLKFAKIQTEQSQRLGYFMDWENSYFTLSDENNYMIWQFLKKCHEKGLIYKGHDSVPWCPRCGTAISQHEMLTEDYKEITHESIFVEYPTEGQQDTYLLVWTTTPWTLPANVAVAVDPKKEYALTSREVEGNKYYVLKNKAKELKLKVLETLKGQDLVGLNYLSPFDHLPRVKKAMGGKPHKVVAVDSLILTISESDGTGLVHIAPGAGTEDFQLGRKLELPVIDVIDEEAVYLSGMEEFSNKNAKDHPEVILDYLKEKDGGRYFFDTLMYTHRYPACWRCGTELVWRVVDEWYISMDPLRNPTKQVAKKINWIPKFGLKRELDWLNNMHDWLISKKRYWGLALPIWECKKCDNFEIIGSYEELKEKAYKGWEYFEGNSPHRPWIDEIKIKCAKCSELSSRIQDVGNPWLDAGIVPFSTITKNNTGDPLYKTDKKEWEKWFPTEFITESFPGQFKNWFYSLIAMSTVLENREPAKTVLGFGTLLGQDGRPMHKSWGNAIEFNEGADKIGVDVMRWIYTKTDPAQNLLFGYELAEQTKRSFHLMLWNVYNFFVAYANSEGWQPTEEKTSHPQNVLDKWIYSRLHKTIEKVTNSLDKYDARTASLCLEEFTSDLSLWYVRRSRDRVGPNAKNSPDKNACYNMLWTVLSTLAKLLAPFLPFFSEEIYKNLTREESVHLSNWPQQNSNMLNEDLEQEMKLLRKIVEKGHRARKQANIPVRQPLQKLVIVHSNEQLKPELLKLVKDELNIKETVWNTDKNTEPDVQLDTTITPQLEEEGKTRELARKIQEERKKLGVALTEEVNVTSPWVPKKEELGEWLRRRTLVKSLTEHERFQVTRV